MECRLAGELGVEGDAGYGTLSNANDLPCVQSEHLYAGSQPSHNRGPNERHLHTSKGRRQAGAFRVDLRAEGIAAHGHIQRLQRTLPRCRV